MVTGVPIVISCSSLVCSLEHFNLEISTRQCRKSPIDGILFCFEALCAQATFQFMSRSITRYHGKNGKRENSRSREREERGRDTQKEFIVPIFFFVGVVWRQHSHKITRDVDAIGDETHRVKEETSRDFSYPLIVLSNMIFCLSLSPSLFLSFFDDAPALIFSFFSADRYSMLNFAKAFTSVDSLLVSYSPSASFSSPYSSSISSSSSSNHLIHLSNQVRSASFQHLYRLNTMLTAEETEVMRKSNHPQNIHHGKHVKNIINFFHQVGYLY